MQKQRASSLPVQKLDIIACGPPSTSTTITTDENGKFIPLLPGLGSHHYSITARNDSARLYFDQGLNFYYGYHFREALASFREAARHDSSCAMAYWGQALAMGPYYNIYYYKMGKEVPGVLKVLNRITTAANAKEKDLITAMLQRYSADTTNADRHQLDSNYALAMQQLMAKYPADNDIKALYIDAVMLQHKWDFWNNNGEPKPWTPPLLQLCKEILKEDSVQPAALHYYIHVSEASRQPEQALHSADVLKDAMPGIGHMVHMATHMYQRNGMFTKAVMVNEDANHINNQVDSLVPSLRLGKNNTIHFYAVQSYCAMNAGMYEKARPFYHRARERLVLQQPLFNKDAYAQFVYMIPVMAMVRLGKWEEVLKFPTPGTDWKYAAVLSDFAQGMAYVRSNNIREARGRLANIRQNLGDSLLAVRIMPFNRPVQGGSIARDLLAGEILYAEGKVAEAISSFKQAVAEEDKLVYREPQDWFIPARQYLGFYLLKLNRAKEAENTYREDLVANPGNGWSLLGMYQSLAGQKRLKDAAKYKAAYKKAFESADVMPTASVF